MLDSSKLKEFAEDNFKFDEYGRKLSKRVENTLGKGEIARYEQFLLFPQCFQKACVPGASKGVIVWEWVNFVDGKRCEMGKLIKPNCFHRFCLLSGTGLQLYEIVHFHISLSSLLILRY